MTEITSNSLETVRLLLRPMHSDDFEALLEIFTDRKVMAAFGGELFTREQMQSWLNRNLEHQAEYSYGLFSVIRKCDGQLIGDCGLEQMTVDGHPVAELGYDFRSDAWGQGFATEAAVAVRDYAFAVLGLAQLISLIRIGNVASQRVAEKAGMQQVAEFEHFGHRYWRYAVERSSVQA